MTEGLPQQGMAWEALEDEMRAMAGDDADWRRGRTALYVFNAGEAVRDVGRNAYAMFMAENGLAPKAFPSLARMEREVVGFGLQLLHAPEGAMGNVSSGGSESILLAMLACREWWRGQGRDTTDAEVVAPVSAHPAFDKAARLLNMRVRRVPLGTDFRADVEAMTAAVDERTVMLVGSAPCFPYGVIDPIEELAAVARTRGLWLHVDACVGGYFAPFAAMNGVSVPAFDFSVPGVTSISADLHKYGYAPKGASTILYRSEDLHAGQVFDAEVWPCGRMTTPTVAGTRPGGAIAAAWAVMRFLGVEGYRRAAEDVCAARAVVEAGVEAIGFRVFGAPVLGLVTFGHPKRDVPTIADRMRQRDWVSARVADPDGIHLMLSPVHRALVRDYLADLEVETMSAPPATGQTAGGFYA